MINIFRLIIVIASMILVYMLLSKDAPDMLKKYNIPTSVEVQDMVLKQVEKHTSTPTIVLNNDLVDKLFYIRNDKIINNGFQIGNVSTEIITKKFGEFGIEAHIRSLELATNSTKTGATVDRIDITGNSKRTLSYAVRDDKVVFTNNDWIVISRGDSSRALLAEVNMIDSTHTTNVLLECILSTKSSDITAPVLAIKLLQCRPPTDKDEPNKIFEFNTTRRYVYSQTLFKGVRVGYPY